MKLIILHTIIQDSTLGSLILACDVIGGCQCRQAKIDADMTPLIPNYGIHPDPRGSQDGALLQAMELEAELTLSPVLLIAPMVLCLPTRTASPHAMHGLFSLH